MNTLTNFTTISFELYSISILSDLIFGSTKAYIYLHIR